MPFRGDWAIFFKDCEQPVDQFSTREAALRKAYELARGKPSDVIVYGEDGKI